MLGAIGCGGKGTTKNRDKDLNRPSAFMTDSFKHFENEAIAFDYPSNMFVEEEVNNMSDTVEGLKKGFDVSVYRMDTHDSLLFCGSPAASVTFAFKGEQGDTLVQHQLAVLRKNNDLFYLNSIAPNYLYDEVQALADTVFHSFKFK